jgi:hypothetical protein
MRIKIETADDAGVGTGPSIIAIFGIKL